MKKNWRNFVLNFKKIVFCFPYRGVGGVSLLFSRIANEISNNYDVSVIDYHDGFLADNINENVSLIEYSDHQECKIPDDSIVVFQAMTPWSLFPSLRMNNSTRLFFWHCHPYNLVPSYPYFDEFFKSNRLLNKLIYRTLLHNYWKKTDKFLDYLLERNAIAFMDRPNLEMTKYFFQKKSYSDREYLRIPACSVTNALPTYKSGRIRFGWLGRITDFKYSMLEHILMTLDLVAKSSNSEIEFMIIGSGSHYEHIKSCVKNVSNIKVQCIEYISPLCLDDFIINNIDIMFAMGTSALESAKLKVPTVLVDFSYKKIPSAYVFELIFNKSGETLGDDISNARSLNSNGCGSYQSIKKIVEDIEHGHFFEYSNRTIEYFTEFHDISNIISSFLRMLECSNAKYSDLYSGKVIFHNGKNIYSAIKNLKRG
ncbi:hypothetical protein RQV70_003742 [Vibrio fluvialis]|nr:hypothetical protein [Vibrio fluvialis]ELI1812578.1 hypothetical protein [Vibrio fluvialis]